MMGRIYMAQQHYSRAVESLQQVLDQDKELVSETLPMLQECYQHLQQPQVWAEFLKRCVEENTGATAELLLGDILEQEQGTEAAQVYITRQLQRHPTMRVFHRLMDFHLNDAEDGRAKRACWCCATWSASKSAPNRAIPAASAASPHNRSTGTVLPAAPGQASNLSAAWTASNGIVVLNAQRIYPLSYNILRDVTNQPFQTLSARVFA